MQVLEAQLIQRAKDAKRIRLENIKSENEPTLSEADRADMRVFLDHMLSMLPVLGVSAFELSRAADANVASSTSSTLLICTGICLQAQGYESTQGFVVKAQSQASLALSSSMQEQMRGIVDLRLDLINNTVLERVGDCYVFTQDYSFPSPLTAAAIVLGRGANGRIEWKDAGGRTLKAIQMQQAVL